MHKNLIDQFDEERTVIYRGEKYLVRDNGAICRLGRPGKRERLLDNVWTFGNPSRATGYMMHSCEAVHRIVATAFHGNPPSPQHIVDHISTNRRNNRPDNLRWLTRRENIEQNPYTLRKIITKYGSIDNFFKNPKDYGDYDESRNYLWMRPVSKEEARASLQRLEKWAASKQSPSGVLPGEWVYSTKENNISIIDEFIHPSLTPLAIQKNWRTPCEFPLCPNQIEVRPLTEYVSNLEGGKIFSRNQYGHSTVIDVQLHENKSLISIITQLDNLKPVAVAKITIKDGKFCHEACGSFFSFEGALKKHHQNLELLCDDLGECIDDYC